MHYSQEKSDFVVVPYGTARLIRAKIYNVAPKFKKVGNVLRNFHKNLSLSCYSMASENNSKSIQVTKK